MLDGEQVFPTVRNAWRSCQHPSQATLRNQFSNTCPERHRQSFPLTDSLLSSSPDHFLTSLFLHNFFLFHYEHCRIFLLGVKRLPSAFSCFHHLLFSQLQLCFTRRLQLPWTCSASVASLLLVFGLLLNRSQLQGLEGPCDPLCPSASPSSHQHSVGRAAQETPGATSGKGSHPMVTPACVSHVGLQISVFW